MGKVRRQPGRQLVRRSVWTGVWGGRGPSGAEWCPGDAGLNKMLKFINIGQQNPPKRVASNRKDDFNEIYVKSIMPFYEGSRFVHSENHMLSYLEW